MTFVGLAGDATGAESPARVGRSSDRRTDISANDFMATPETERDRQEKQEGLWRVFVSESLNT